MREIRIGVFGLILSGEETGRYLRVVDDAENTGGFLILTSADRAGATDVHDAWVESIVDVDLYLDESAWEIEWDPGGRAVTSAGDDR
jgi:hypothetical protein